MNTDNRQEPQIRVWCHNPYESRFPDRRVITYDMLRLVKRLRKENITVQVLPDNGSKVYYLAQKGLTDLLSDPTVLYVVGIPISILTGLISTWIWDRIKRPARDVSMNLVIHHHGSNQLTVVNHCGQPLDEQSAKRVQEQAERARREFRGWDELKPPDARYPVPLNLEHTGRVVGWGKLSLNDKGMRVDVGIITDPEVARGVTAGELRGLSIGALVTDAVCRVCGSDYVECNHDGGAMLGGIDLAEISIVEEPINPECTIKVVTIRDE